MNYTLKYLYLILLVITFINLRYAFGNSSKSDITRADTLNIIHYDIHLDIKNFEAKQIRGYTEIILTPKVKNINTIALDLLKLQIDSVTERHETSEELKTYFYNDTLIQIPLGRLINITDTIKLRVYYHGQPQLDPSFANWGGFFFTDNYAFNLGVGFGSDPHPIGRFWFPCLDDFKSRSLYDFYIRTEKTHTAVCNGLLVKVNNNGDNTQTFHWQMKNTIPTYLASVAVSDYVAVNDSYTGIKSEIPVNIYVNPKDTGKAKASFIHLKPILSIFEKDFGPYEWQRVGCVGVPFLYGAMEHATNITYPNSFIDSTLTYESFYAHELSHHWFGDLVTCSTAEDMWLNEGWARYCEFIYREGLYGKQSYKDNVRDNHRYVLESVYITDNGYRAIYGIPSDYTYSSTVYDKGADVIHTLRNYIGDSLFFNTVKSYLKQYSFNNISTEQFKDFFSDNTGINLNDFFNTWVYDKGFPHFSVDSFRIAKSETWGSIVDVYLRQRLRGTAVYSKSNKTDINFRSKDWESYTDTIIFSGEYAHKTFIVPFTPDVIMIDKDEKVADATTDNYMIIKTAGTYDFPDTYFQLTVNNINDSAFVRAEHNWVAPDKPKKLSNAVYRISQERYWKIDGIFPEGFNAKGRFFFSRTTNLNNGYLDNGLLTGLKSSDSLILLYRRNTADDWRIIPFTKKSSYTNGYIYTDNLKPGEYCLGIGQPFQSVETVNPEPVSFNIFPNPGNGEFDIEYEIKTNALINIFDIKGNKVDSIIIYKGHKTIKWDARNLSNGAYILKLFNSKNRFVTSKTVIKS
jgi:hypothetical protein